MYVLFIAVLMYINVFILQLFSRRFISFLITRVIQVFEDGALLGQHVARTASCFRVYSMTTLAGISYHLKVPSDARVQKAT